MERVKAARIDDMRIKAFQESDRVKDQCCVVRERKLSGRVNGESSLTLLKETGRENGYLREMNVQKGHGNEGLAESARVSKNQRMDGIRDEKASQKWYGSLNEHTAPKREKTSSWNLRGNLRYAGERNV